MHWRYVGIVTATVCVMCFVASSSKRKNIEYGSFGLRSRRKQRGNGGGVSLQPEDVGAELLHTDWSGNEDTLRRRWWRQPLVNRESDNSSNTSTESNATSTVDAALPPIAHVHFMSIDTTPPSEERIADPQTQSQDHRCDDCANLENFAARAMNEFASAIASPTLQVDAVRANATSLCFRHFLSEPTDRDGRENRPERVSFSIEKVASHARAASAARYLAATLGNSARATASQRRALRNVFPTLQRFLKHVVDPEDHHVDAQRTSLDGGSIEDEGTVTLPIRRSVMLLIVVIGHTPPRGGSDGVDGLLLNVSLGLSAHVQKRALATGNSDRIEVVVAPTSICSGHRPQHEQQSGLPAAIGTGANWRCPDVTLCSRSSSPSESEDRCMTGGVMGCCTHHVLPEALWKVDAEATGPLGNNDAAPLTNGPATRFARTLRMWLSTLPLE